ncbi:SHOCT domain-containing protein [Dyadobacter sp. CY345]|uniref:SHOCT domain-containing protein n=1 Tax=Dyadobacter sp. CY345 TaxID=2909335 RepID=UPI001F24844C|nr:SHOCT domain-containing protein [Dyadobacter sp. CY345]MCF2445770.1 SHOCT domain-containing protein [Dyadobacter sp. CY345]
MWWFILIVLVIIVFGLLVANYESKKKAERSGFLQSKLTNIENFKISTQIDGYGGSYIFAIDDSNRKIGLVTINNQTIVDFSDIIGIELIEDGNIISKKSITSTVSGAVIGGLLAGGVGTIVGGLSGSSTEKNQVSSISVKILLRSLETPSLNIKCFDSKAMTIERKSSIETEGTIDSYIYQTCRINADKIKDLLSVIIDQMNTENREKFNSNAAISISDELLKLNELKEKGILTESEFNTQKYKLLNN